MKPLDPSSIQDQMKLDVIPLKRAQIESHWLVRGVLSANASELQKINISKWIAMLIINGLCFTGIRMRGQRVKLKKVFLRKYYYLIIKLLSQAI